MENNAELLLQNAPKVRQWEHEERASYDLETLRAEFLERLYPSQELGKLDNGHRDDPATP